VAAERLLARLLVAAVCLWVTAKLVGLLVPVVVVLLVVIIEVIALVRYCRRRKKARS
jgi:Flp pilus assembly protein TadB